MPQLVRKKEQYKGKVVFYKNPLVELFASMHIFSEPERYPHWAHWMKVAREQMGEDLVKTLDELNEQYDQSLFIMDLATHLAVSNVKGEKDLEKDFEDCFADLKGMSLEDFAIYMLGLEVLPEVEEWKETIFDRQAEAIAESTRIYGNIMTNEVMLNILNNTKEIKDKLEAFVMDYWKSAFEELWNGLEENQMLHMENHIVEYGELGLYDYLKQYYNELTEIGDGKYSIKKSGEFIIDTDDFSRINIFFSVFTSPDFMYNIVKDNFILYHNLLYQEGLIHAEVDDEWLKSLKALSEENRLKIFRVLWKGEATTKELASMLFLAESTVSAHLKAFWNVGLVKARRSKKFMYYTANKELFTEVISGLQNYMDR